MNFGAPVSFLPQAAGCEQFKASCKLLGNGRYMYINS